MSLTSDWKTKVDSGVYVPANTIDAKGNTNWLEGRKTKEIGRVLELNTIGKVNQLPSSSTVAGDTQGWIPLIQLYMEQRKDNNTYNGDVANTSTLVKMVKDDPRDMSQLSYGNGRVPPQAGGLRNSTNSGNQAGIRFSGIGGTRLPTHRRRQREW